VPYPGQIFEAIVTSGSPSSAHPGHIVVQIPELYPEGVDFPVLIPPVFPVDPKPREP
jgi:hypothetical protein